MEHVEEQGEGYRKSDAINDALKPGLRHIRGEPRWVPVASTLANITAIGCMVAGMFILAGIGNGAMLSVFAANAVVMIVSLALRLSATTIGDIR